MAKKEALREKILEDLNELFYQVAIEKRSEVESLIFRLENLEI